MNWPLFSQVENNSVRIGLRICTVRIATLYLCVFCVAVSHAQIDVSSDNHEASDTTAGSVSTAIEGLEPVAARVESSNTVDEITVTGMATRHVLRRQIVTVENEIYAMYNDLNGDDQYDVICKMVARIGSQIKRRVCKVRYTLVAEAQDTEGIIDGSGATYSAFDVRRSSKGFRENMAAIANANPKLKALLERRISLQESFDATKSERSRP